MAAIGHNAAAQVRSFVERIENIEAAISGMNNGKRDVYGEAKEASINVPALKAVIARRRKDPDKLAELDAAVDEYMAALGAAASGPYIDRARVQEADPLDIPAELRRDPEPSEDEPRRAEA